MKLLMITDLHHGSDESEYHVSKQLDFLKWVGSVATEKGVHKIVNLGDTHHRRLTASFRIMDKFKTEHAKLADSYEMTVLAGNHDCYYTTSNRITSLPHFFPEQGVHLVEDDIRVVKEGDRVLVFIPWLNTENSERIAKKVREYNKKGNILFAHLELSGFVKNDKSTNENNSLNKSDYNKFDFVFSGHYHGKQEKGNVFYLGAGYQQNFGELEKKYIHIYDTDTGEVEAIENKEDIYRKILVPKDATDDEIKKLCKGVGGKIIRVFIDSTDMEYIIKVESIIESEKPHSRDIHTKNINDAIEDVDLDSEEMMNMDETRLNAEFLEKFDYISKKQEKEFKQLFADYWNQSGEEI